MSTKVSKSSATSKIVKSLVAPGKKPGITSLVKKTKAKKQTALSVTYGADPECMVFDTELGRIVSAIPILKCGKHDPIDLGNGVKLFADNTLCEFGLSPSDDRSGFIQNMKDALSRVQEHLGDRYRLYPQAAHHFTDEEMVPSYGQDPTMVGCNPSVDCLKEAINMPKPFVNNMRTGSFHLHIGNADWKKNADRRLLTYDSRHDAIKLLNIYVGLGTVMFSKDNTSKDRRAIYGRAYEARITPYGCEYRTTEPYPLRSPDMVGLVFDLAEHAIQHIKNFTEKDIIGSVDLEEVGRVINECDAEAAKKILFKLDLTDDLRGRVSKDYGMPDLKAAWGI